MGVGCLGHSWHALPTSKDSLGALKLREAKKGADQCRWASILYNEWWTGARCQWRWETNVNREILEQYRVLFLGTIIVLKLVLQHFLRRPENWSGRQQSICATYGARKSGILYLKVHQAWSSYKHKLSDSRVFVSFPASRASLIFKRCWSSQHSKNNAPLITMLLGSFIVDTSPQPNLPPFRCVPSASGSVGIYFLCSSVLKIKNWHLDLEQSTPIF